MHSHADFALWKWRQSEYTKARLSEIYRSDEPGQEGDRALAAMELLAERATSRAQPSPRP